MRGERQAFYRPVLPVSPIDRSSSNERIDRRVVECLAFWIGRGFFVREPDFTDRLFDLSGSMSRFQCLNRKTSDGNTVILAELVLYQHSPKLLQDALFPACRLSGGIGAP